MAQVSVGPLHGIPIVVKDNIDVVGLPMTAGFQGWKNYYPPQDAPLVKKLRAAGAIILAKASLSEFTLGISDNINSVLPGFTRNPYNTAYGTGGSSGGTGAALAASFAVVGAARPFPWYRCRQQKRSSPRLCRRRRWPRGSRSPAARPNAALAPPEPNRVEKPVPRAGNPAPAKVEPAKAPQSNSQATLDKEDPALACSRDELRLARLRSNPVPDEIAQFQRELSCDRLRAQAQRLFESVATGPSPSAAPAAPANAVRKPEPNFDAVVRPQAQAPPVQPENACARDAEHMARLRADPTVDAIARFERELGCERIRPQLRLLRESVGVGQ